MNILFVIDSGVIGTDYIKNIWNDGSLQVIYLTNINNQEGDTLRNLTEDYFIQCNTENYYEVLNIIKYFSHENIIGITTFVDSKLELCAKLCKELNLPGVDYAVINLKNKAYVNSLIPQYVPESINFNIKNIPYELIRELLYKSSKGLILKPAYADGARGVSFLNTNEDINNITELIDKELPLSVHPDEIVVQEVVDGELISIEGYVINGKVTFIGVTGRRKIRNTESIFIFPYSDKVPEEKLEEARQAINLLVEKSNYSRGFFHTEFILSDKSIKLIDCNFGRPCGANIIEVIACSYDISPEDIYKQAISIQISGTEVIERDFWENTKATDSIGIAYGIKQSGKVLQIKIDEKLHTKHRIIQNMGCSVLRMGESDWSWLGLLSGKAQDVMNDIEKIQIRTEYGWERPMYYQNLYIE